MKPLIALLSLLPALGCSADQHLYLAAGGEMTVYDIDADAGRLSVAQKVALPGAGPFGFSPDGKRLYAMSVKDDGPAIATFDRHADGSLTLVHQEAVNLRAGYLAVDQTGRFITGNHYGPGRVSVWKLDQGVYRGETVQELELEPEAHGVTFSRDNRWLLVPATGPNKVFVNRFDSDTGRLTPNDPPFGEAPDQPDQARHPRHLVFNPSKKDVAYTTNESGEPGVCVWQWDEKAGTLKPIQNIVTRPEGFEGRLSTADLHQTPDAAFLYISNRDRAGGSSIVGFRVDPETGRLTFISHTPCENVPRSFCLDHAGRFVYVAGQIDNRLGVYAIDPKTGRLTKVEQHEVGDRPIWVEAR